jgi:DNA-binding Lrp family transcriptional regulator
LEKAYVLLNVEMGSESEVRNSLKEIPNVKEVHEIYSVYDLIIYVEAETLKKLKGLMNRIRDISKIRATLPLVCIEEKRTILW